MNPRTMDAACLRALRRRGHSDASISAMTPEEAFCEYCAYHGIMNMMPATLEMLDKLRAETPAAVTAPAI
ncbi:hypothetical protein [Duganella fentianensis]|uniref:hypothetical protein n=1 Tax=Duganella fentianensis TaxID=2692177 RepID=UPI0032B1E8AA